MARLQHFIGVSTRNLAIHKDSANVSQVKSWKRRRFFALHPIASPRNQYRSTLTSSTIRSPDYAEKIRDFFRADRGGRLCQESAKSSFVRRFA